MYLVSKDNKKMVRKLEIFLIIVSVAYALLFLWQLYVVALFTSYAFYILPLAVITIGYFIISVLRKKLKV